MTNQIMKPALQFLELAVSDANKIFDDIKIKCDNEKKRTNILDFCKNKEEKEKDKREEKEEEK